MSNKIWNIDIDFTAIALVVGIFVLTILCVGEPDLLDAIIAWIGRQP